MLVVEDNVHVISCEHFPMQTENQEGMNRKVCEVLRGNGLASRCSGVVQKQHKLI